MSLHDIRPHRIGGTPAQRSEALRLCTGRKLMRDQGGSREVFSYLVQQVEHCGHGLDITNVEKHDTREIGCFRHLFHEF